VAQHKNPSDRIGRRAGLKADHDRKVGRKGESVVRQSTALTSIMAIGTKKTVNGEPVPRMRAPCRAVAGTIGHRRLELTTGDTAEIHERYNAD